ncbi:MAG: hypothetical protein JSV03_06960 [Planctomycetota bacterium]|nr:MAG: hypothetical protein JSV03_06960 [Planctomycetota bacterium]
MAIKSHQNRVIRFSGIIVTLFLCAAITANLDAFMVNVEDPAGNPVSGFRWLLEEDNTNQPTPGALVTDSLAVDIHKSHAPVVDKGRTAGASAVINVPNDKP